MTQAGLHLIKLAKENGWWTILDDAEALIIPPDLEDAFEKYSGSKAFYLSHSPSIQKQMLSWIALAQRPETRAKRIEEIATSAADQKKPKGFV